MTPRIGSLFSGSGQLDEGVRAVLGGTVAWHAEIEPAAVRVLDHRYPGVPNLGDVSTVDWADVEPVDVLTGGFPCQDVSHAGARRGMREGTRSGLWARMCDAIDALRPPLVIAENVRGLLSAEADSALEPCPGCVGDGDDGAVLRALGRVLGDLAGIGYDARWCGLRAADVGAPHGRFRVFIVAEHAAGQGPQGQTGRRVQHSLPRSGHRGLVAATDAERGEGVERHGADMFGGRSGEAEQARMGAVTPADTTGARDGGDAGVLHDTSGAARGQRADEGRFGDAAIGGGATAADATSAERRRPESDHLGPRPLAAAEPRERTGETAWGVYEPAIRRWANVLNRPAPAPTETGPKGGQRLSPRFTEFMMGWPDGWVTDVPGVSRNEALKLCGNGVVPQQAAEALRRMLATAESEAVA